MEGIIVTAGWWRKRQIQQRCMCVGIIAALRCGISYPRAAAGGNSHLLSRPLGTPGGPLETLIRAAQVVQWVIAVSAVALALMTTGQWTSEAQTHNGSGSSMSQ